LADFGCEVALSLTSDANHFPRLWLGFNTMNRSSVSDCDLLTVDQFIIKIY
jgi:hypothetical protein